MYGKDEIKTPRIFRPYGTVVLMATTTSTSAVALLTRTDAPNEEPHVRLVNSSTADIAQYSFGTGTASTAGSNSAFLLPGQVEIIDRGLNSYLACVSVSGTCLVSATTGFGIAG